MIASIPGLVLGIVALSKIKRSNGAEKGRGMAIAGIATSSVGILLLFGFLILFGASIAQPPM